jgi:hypothetical protein
MLLNGIVINNLICKIMNRGFYILLFLYICGIIHAQEYQISEIEEIAYSFFNSGPQRIQGIDDTYATKQIASIEAISRNSKDYMYIANTENSSGWVILSNERAYPTIIAHSDSGSLTYDEELLPPALLCILENHMNAIDSTRNDLENDTIVNYPHKLATTPTLLYKTKNLIDGDYWKQTCNNDAASTDPDKIYNKFSPHLVTCKADCGNEPVGCGPVAMSKIMRYWQWPDYAVIGGIHDTTYYYDWEHMPIRIDNNTDMYKVDAVAHLFRSCGQAATTAYTCAGSATVASEIHDAMKEVFGFHSNLVRDWEDVNISSMLMNEIDQGRPVLVQAHKATIFQGHSFVVDGYKLYDDHVEFHVHFGWGGDYYGGYNYFDLTFNGYKNGQIFLVELYPLCDLRSNSVVLSSALTISANNNRTYYSTNNVIIGSNNNSVVVNNGGHLMIKAGEQVRVKDGFRAKTGSNVRIMIDTLCDPPSTAAYSAPQRIASSKTEDDTEGSTNDVLTNNTIEDVESEMIQSTAIYTISGQLLQTIEGSQYDAAHLPDGMYILQHRMSDGSMRNEKVTNYK